MDKPKITRALAQIVGEKFVISQPDDLRVYSYDASNNSAVPDFVVVPENTEQVSRVIKLARQQGLVVVPRGAGTRAVRRRHADCGRDHDCVRAHEKDRRG